MTRPSSILFRATTVFRAATLRVRPFLASLPMLALLAGPPLLAASPQTVVEFNPAGTHVEFTVGSLLHTVHGTFRLKSGLIRFEPDTGQASGAIVVDAASGDSGSSGRDNRMKNKVLEANLYPEIVFTPERVEGAFNPSGASDLNIRGTFRIHGVDHPFILPVHAAASGAEIDATTKFEVPYVKWGMKDPSTFILKVSDKVEIAIQATGRLSTQVAAGALRKDL